MIHRQKQFLLMTLLFNFIFSSVVAQTRGEQLYLENCMVCHGDDGSGAMPGVSNLTDNRAWSILPESQLITRLKQGIQKPGSAVTMPPKGGNADLTDTDLRMIIQYMRTEFL